MGAQAQSKAKESRKPAAKPVSKAPKKAVSKDARPAKTTGRRASAPPAEAPAVKERAPLRVVDAAPVKPAKPAPAAAEKPSGRRGAPSPIVVPVAPIIPEGPAEVFVVGDMAVHPQHGVGELASIELKSFGDCYVIRIIDTGLKVMVPVATAQRVGLRRVMKKEEAQGILEILRAPEVAVDVQPWNRRFRAYQDMLKSGLPSEIAKVLRDMYRLKFDKDLSFGERRLLDQARSLLVQELALAKQVAPSSIDGEIQQIFCA